MHGIGVLDFVSLRQTGQRALCLGWHRHVRTAAHALAWQWRQRSPCILSHVDAIETAETVEALPALGIPNVDTFCTGHNPVWRFAAAVFCQVRRRMKDEAPCLVPRLVRLIAAFPLIARRRHPVSRSSRADYTGGYTSCSTAMHIRGRRIHGTCVNRCGKPGSRNSPLS